MIANARSSLRPQRELALENLALRQQLAVVQRKTKRPKLSKADRAFWVALTRLWPDWQSALILVKPETVISWHRKGFKLYWTWKSRNRGGRPAIDSQIRTLIRRMARNNLTWGAPRIHGELLKLGFEVSEATVSRYMPRRRTPPSQSWPAFLRNHAKGLVSIDFFVVPTAMFRVLYVFVVLEHDRRRILHFNVTEGPFAQWTGQQLANAFPYDSARSISSATETRFMAQRSFVGCARWESSRSSLRPDRRGKIHTANASSAPFDGTASTTSLWSESSIYGASSGSISSTITVAGPTSRSTRTPPNRASKSLTQATGLWRAIRFGAPMNHRPGSPVP